MGTDIKSETQRPTSSYAKFDYDTVCAGVLFLIQNPAHVERVYKYLDADYFFIADESMQVKALRCIVKTILEIRKFYGISTMTPAFFDTKLAQMVDSEVNVAARQLFHSWLTNPKILEKATDRGCQAVFLDFLRVIEIVKWSQEFMPKYKSGMIADAVKSMKELTGTLDSIKFNDISEAVDVSTMEMQEIQGLLSLPSSSKGEIFLLGQPDLDEDIGGFERRALHIFIAATNGGKSMMTHHLISECIRQGLYVHISVVEDRPKSFYRRLFANLTGIEINRLKYNWENLTPNEMKLIENAKALIAKWVKVSFDYGCDLTSIHQKKIDYDAERTAAGLKPYDVDIVDYTGHVAEKSMGEKTYEKFRNAFAERKNYCLVSNKIGFDFAQVNRAGFQKKQNNLTLTHGELAGSYDLSQVCDNIISINRFPDDIDANTATLLITKVKDGKLGNKGYKVGTDFARARWNMNMKEMDLNATIRVQEVSQAL